MASKLLLPLIVLITRFGVVYNGGIKIETFKGKIKSDSTDANTEIGAFIFSGGDGKKSPGNKIPGMKSHFGCFEKKKILTIVFGFVSSNTWAMNLNVAIDSAEFGSYENQNAKLEKMIGDKYYFVFGTWWPKESTTFLFFGSNTVQLYLNFLTNVLSINLNEVIYFRSEVEDKQIRSTLMIEPQYDPPTKKQLDNGNFQWLDDLLEKVPKDIKVEKNKSLLNECFGKSKFCIGSLQHDKKGSETSFEFNQASIKLKGIGELNMAFVTNKIDIEKALEAVTAFAKSGITEKAITTPYANVECVNEGIKFTLLNPKKDVKDNAKKGSKLPISSKIPI